MSSVLSDDSQFFRHLQQRRVDIENDDSLSARDKQQAWSQQLRKIQTFMVRNQRILNAPLTPPPEDTGSDDGLAANV